MMTLYWTHESKTYTTELTELRHIRIGRDPACEIHKVGPSVSARHVEVFFYQGHFYLRNLKPNNPVRVNQQVIERSVRLKPNDTLTFGDMTFVVRSIEQRKVGVRCNNCQNTIDLSYFNKECPICGHALVNGTVVGIAEV
ncbi:FHA domain-containing protein [bacterium]|nr:FHA domain-containing protein [bacterium]